MRITNVTYTKQLKIGLPNYSNVTVGMSVTTEIPEGEEPNHDNVWDIVNKELKVQADAGTDPSWIVNKETKHNYTATVRTPKP